VEGGRGGEMKRPKLLEKLGGGGGPKRRCLHYPFKNRAGGEGVLDVVGGGGGLADKQLSNAVILCGLKGALV
jgi:hypothetical protein